MGKYILEINDADGNTGRIQLSLPFAKQQADEGNSTWQTLSQGFIKYHSGGCEAGIINSDPKSGKSNIILLSGKSVGIFIYRFIDRWGIANDSGAGRISQSWCLQCKPGDFGWTLIS